MNIKNFRGATFIANAYDGANTTYVGIAIDVDGKRVETLVLGSLTPIIPDVFRRREAFPFPSYRKVWVQDVHLYQFKKEIDLCKYLASSYDEVPDLVTESFQINNKRALVCLDAARHIMIGGGIKTYRKWEPFADEHFLLLWAVLHRHFPERAQRPPEEWTPPEGEECFHIYANGHDVPFVTVGPRETLNED